MSNGRPETGRIVIAVDLDYFFAQIEEVRKPELKKVPVVVCVYSGRNADSGAVSTSNYIARRLGVKSGIPIIRAKKILSNHPEAVFLPMDKEYYSQVSDQIMQILRPHVSKMEQVSIDEAYLDATEETSGSYEAAKNMALQIKKEIIESDHLTCSIGIGPSKLVAKMAADAKKPDGLTVVQPAEVHAFLNPLPVGKLFGIGPKTEEKLELLNIKTIEDLSKFDEEKLVAEFGKNLGPRLKRSAEGLDDEPVQEKVIDQLSRIITLKHNAMTFDFALDLEPLIADLTLRLKARQLLCSSVGIIVITSTLKIKSRAKKLEAPANSELKIRETVLGLFKLFFSENRNIEARRVGIKISGLTKEGPGPNSSLMQYLN